MAQAKFAVVATRAVTFFISICVMLASVSSALAENTRGPYEHESYLALPSQKCRISPPSEWTKPENWVWEKICEGKVANFDKHPDEHPDARPFDPRKQEDSENWSDRTLRSSFLETILLHEPFRSAIPRQGVHIIGAYFPEPIDLSDASIDRLLTLSLSRFRSKVGMRRLTTSSFIALGGSEFECELDMQSVTVEGSLIMGDGAEFNQEVVLAGAKVGGQIVMSGSTFNGNLHMDFVTVNGSLMMRGRAEFNQGVLLAGAKVGGLIDMSGSKFNDNLLMDATTVEGSLFMDRAEFNQGVVLAGAKVGGVIIMSGSKFNDNLWMNSVTVEGSLFMDSAEFNQGVVLRGAKVGGLIDMSGSKFNDQLNMNSVSVEGSLLMLMRRVGKVGEIEAPFREVDLSGANIGSPLNMNGSTFNGNLHMDFVTVNGSLMMQKASFKNSAHLLLRHSNVGTLTLQDDKDDWPEIFRLDGFTYQGLGGMDEGNRVGPLMPESGWFEEWLKKHKPYSPQPYRQLASVLRTSGQGDMANDILVASRDRELEESNMLEGKWWGLFLLKIFINYGYGKGQLLALGWAGALLLIGVIVLHLTKERDRHEKEIHKLLDTMFYSLDMLLPIIRLRELHYKNVDLKTGARYYFYFHKIRVYVLTLFLIAALSGLAS